MSYSDWLLPRRDRDDRRMARHIFYIRDGEQIDRCREEMVRSGVNPIQFFPELGIVIAENRSTVSLQSIESNSGVEYIESDIRITLNEPRLGSIRPLQKKDELPWGVKYVGADKVWSKATGKGVRIAVMDTGIESKHSVISKNYVNGINILSKNNPPQDYNGHGTHVAGTAAGKSSESGLHGVAPDAEIMAVKTFNRKGSANLTDLLAGLNYCINLNKDDDGKKKRLIVNMSFGMDKLSDSLRIAIQTAHREGIVMIAATGNKGQESKIDFPARYPETIGVTSISKNGKASSFSNMGKGTDIAAPGDGIASAWLNDSKREMSGTSMAVPHVTGAMALLLELKPNLNPEQLRYAVLNSATKSKAGDLLILNIPEAVRLIEQM